MTTVGVARVLPHAPTPRGEGTSGRPVCTSTCVPVPDSWVPSGWRHSSPSARLVALGATRFRLLSADDVNESCIVMQDVEGNELCLD